MIINLVGSFAFKELCLKYSCFFFSLPTVEDMGRGRSMGIVLGP